MGMVKKAWSTRLDENVLVLAQRVAEAERRSVTAVFEVAVIEYAERRGIAPAGAAPKPPARKPKDEE